MARQKAKTDAKADPKITLCVYDYAGLRADLLSRALTQAEIILGDAGGTVAATLCTRDKTAAVCKQAPDPLSIILRIVPKPAPGPECDALAYASGQCITVNFSRVVKYDDDSSIFLERLLGCVVAHELGHVLLGADSHSEAGIMKARMTNKDLRLIRLMPLWFLPSQKKQIRDSVLLRERETRDLETGSIVQAER